MENDVLDWKWMLLGVIGMYVTFVRPYIFNTSAGKFIFILSTTALIYPIIKYIILRDDQDIIKSNSICQYSALHLALIFVPSSCLILGFTILCDDCLILVLVYNFIFPKYYRGRFKVSRMTMMISFIYLVIKLLITAIYVLNGIKCMV